MKYLNARNTAYGEDRRSYKTGTNGVTSNQTVFNVSYDNGRVEAYLNGVRLYPGDDFTKSSSGIGTNITLASAIGANNVLEVVGYQGINSGNALVEDNFVVGTASTGSGGSYTNSTTVFPVASSAGDTVSVWRNGVKLVPTTDYTVQASASTVTLVSAASSADEITVQVVGGVIHNNGLTVNSGNDSFFLPTTRGTNNYVLTRDDSVGTGGTAWKETIQNPTITGIKYSNQTSGTFAENSGQTATDPAGGDLVQLTGSHFDSTQATPADASNVAITIDGTSATSILVNSAKTEVTFAPPAKSAGSYTLTATNGSGLNATTTIVYDSVPSWTATGALGNFVNGSGYTNSSTPNIRIQASEGSDTITYRQTDSSGNTVTSGVAGLTLGTSGANAGYLTGTLNGTDGATNNFYAVATDAELQDTNSAPTLFNIITRAYAGYGGGTISTDTYVSGYRLHIFNYNTSSTTDQTFTLYEAKTCDILVVAGGGGGGGHGGGGGGAGGILFNHATNRANTSNSSVSLSTGDYTIRVGSGGAVGVNGGSTNADKQGKDGDNSSFINTSGATSINITATGGGGGGSYNGIGGRTGGSGGGGGYGGGGGGNATGNQGYAGGTAKTGYTVTGGGGGGAGGTPATPAGNQTSTGHGGTGISFSSIFSTSLGDSGSFAGGGGSGSETAPGGTGGSGGGGNGAFMNNNSATQGADGTGGGGGGGYSSYLPGRGGHGIVVIRYAI